MCIIYMQCAHVYCYGTRKYTRIVMELERVNLSGRRDFEIVLKIAIELVRHNSRDSRKEATVRRE